MPQISEIKSPTVGDSRGSGRFDVRSLPTPPVFLHIVTLLKRSTGEEACLEIETLSDRFIDVLNEIAHQKAVRELFGYEIWEVLPCNEPPF